MKRFRNEPGDVTGESSSKSQTTSVSQGDCGAGRGILIPVSISNPNIPLVGSSDGDTLNSQVSLKPGYSSAMASDAIFRMFPGSGGQQDPELYKISDDDRFIQKQYPMLYMNLNAHEHPSITNLRYENKDASCSLCELDRNTLDSIKVLKPHEVKAYLKSYNHRFTDEQVNTHLAHTVKDDNVIGVLQNMSVDLINKSYSLANTASLGIMNHVTTHMGRQGRG